MDEKSLSQNAKIIPRLIQDEMKKSYLDYSMSVIIGRALPDVRDGLKPVHRRVLYAMWENSLLHNKPYKKSANVVGNTMAKFHPHGDSAIYDTLVRLAQSFSMRYPLVDGHGNFGSIDGDAPAAMRYTECRLQKLAEEMLGDIDKRTVKMVTNFDNSAKEPTVLPSKLPNLLINGSSGIAVGMATNIPPHNMNEVIGAVILQIDNPSVEIHELMANMKGPDFPTGGIICGRNSIVNAYNTGRGKLTVRAKTSYEQVKNREAIIISEIPYMVNKSELIEEIADCVRDKRIKGIYDIRDESDRDGMRIVIELNKDSDQGVVVNQLFEHTRLQTTFGIIMLSLVDNVPKVLNLKQMIHYFIEHRKDVIRKRVLFDLNKAQTSAHILEGLIVASENIDEIIKLIRSSKSPEVARNSLMAKFNLTQEQSTAILEMRLQKLTTLEQDKSRKELKDLLLLIDELEAILKDQAKILEIVKKELIELNQKFSDGRRTQIIDNDIEDVIEEDLIKDETVALTITNTGYIKRIPLAVYKAQHRGGKGLIATTTKEEDIVKDIIIANTHDTILFFTNAGVVHWLKSYQVPEAARTAKGKAIVNLLSLQNDEKVTACVPVKEFNESSYILMLTRKGTIKKTPSSAFSNPRKGGIVAVKLEKDDELINVELTNGSQEIIIASREGNAVRFRENNVRPSGRSSQGVRGINLKKEDIVVGMVVLSDNTTLFTLTENGFGKRTPIDEYRLISRGGFGVINIQCSERNGKVVSICDVNEKEDIMIISKKGIIIRVPVTDISTIGRNTQGVRIMKLESGDKVVSAVKVSKEEMINFQSESA